MPVITSDTQLLNTQETAKNKAAYELKLQQFKEIDETKKKSGVPKAQTKQRDLGKLPVRQRIELLLDKYLHTYLKMHLKSHLDDQENK